MRNSLILSNFKITRLLFVVYRFAESAMRHRSWLLYMQALYLEDVNSLQSEPRSGHQLRMLDNTEDGAMKISEYHLHARGQLDSPGTRTARSPTRHCRNGPGTSRFFSAHGPPIGQNNNLITRSRFGFSQRPRRHNPIQSREMFI